MTLDFTSLLWTLETDLFATSDFTGLLVTLRTGSQAILHFRDLLGTLLTGLLVKSSFMELQETILRYHVLKRMYRFMNYDFMNNCRRIIDFRNIFFSIRVFFHGCWWLIGQQGKGGEPFFFHSTTSTHSHIFRYIFATLHVRWLSYIFNRTTCIYQTATWWDLPSYWITIWLFDDVMLTSVCLLTIWF